MWEWFFKNCFFIECCWLNLCSHCWATRFCGGGVGKVSTQSRHDLVLSGAVYLLPPVRVRRCVWFANGAESSHCSGCHCRGTSCSCIPGTALWGEPRAGSVVLIRDVPLRHQNPLLPQLDETFRICQSGLKAKGRKRSFQHFFSCLHSHRHTDTCSLTPEIT